MCNINTDIRNLSENIHQAANPVIDDLAQALQALRLPCPMQVDELLNVPEENIVYEEPEIDQIVEQIVDMFKETPVDESNGDEVDDHQLVYIGSSIGVVRQFLLTSQQEGAGEQMKSVKAIEKFIRDTVNAGV